MRSLASAPPDHPVEVDDRGEGLFAPSCGATRLNDLDHVTPSPAPGRQSGSAQLRRAGVSVASRHPVLPAIRVTAEALVHDAFPLPLTAPPENRPPCSWGPRARLGWTVPNAP